MKAQLLQKRGIFWFLGITFVVSWAIMAGMWLAGGPAAAGLASMGLIAAMWVPGLSVLVVSRFVTHETSVGTGVTKIRFGRYHLWAWLLPVLFALSSALLTPLLRAGELDLSLAPVRQALQDAAVQSGGTALPSVQTVFAVQMAFSLFGAPIVGLFLALGEELGWRGYLLRKLLPLGQWPALLLSGAIWGLWHAPLVLMGQNYPDHPVAGPFLMVGFCLLLGIVFGWLQLASGTVWVPALAHGTFNAVNGLPLLVLTGVDRAFGGSPSSLIGWIGIGTFVGWLVLTRRLPVKTETAD
jgi:membrane protease YdiL (CAAX protease family)